MGVLVNHLVRVKDPYWEVLTRNRNRWWQRKDVRIRLVFPYFLEGDETMYRLEYDEQRNAIIIPPNRPNWLLQQYGIDPGNENTYLNELKELQSFLFNYFSNRIHELWEFKP